MNNQVKTSVIILAGGTGTRMQANLPKQFLLLGEKPIARHSFELFSALPDFDEIVVVCDTNYRHFFLEENPSKPILFALPGERRQDSVYNGLLATSPSNEFICVHDAARPFIDKDLILRVLEAAKKHGAATVGMPLKFTVKESNEHNCVKATPDRSRMWEIQTPQVIKRTTLIEGFKYAYDNGITVTDDVSLAELVGEEVKLIEGSQINLKVTVPIDLLMARHLLETMGK